jgi:ABC-type glutathione transport system ATPase component
MAGIGLENSKTWIKARFINWEISSPDSTFAIGPLDFTIERNKAIGIIGKSGSGKSMLIRSLLGLPPDGYVYSEDARLELESEDQITTILVPHSAPLKDWLILRNHLFGYLPQDPVSSFNPISKIKQQLKLVSRVKNIPYTQNEMSVQLESISLSPPQEFLDKYIHQVSGGQAQRIAYIAASIGNPSILLGDEPTASLDAQLVDRIQQLIKDWLSQNGRAAIVTSHDWVFLQEIVENVMVIEGGKIVESGHSESIFKTPKSDITQALANAERDIKAGKRITSRDAQDVRSIVRIDHLSKNFGTKSKDWALWDITIEQIPSHRIGVIGESGSGKSTLGRILSGLIPPTSGEVYINKVPIDFGDPSRHEVLAGKIQYIAQDPYTAFSPRRKLRETLIEVLITHQPNLSQAACLEIIYELLARCQLEPMLLNRYANALSGGQRQRMVLLRALLCNPDVLVLDEITSALDHISQKSILDLISGIVEEKDVECWLISHNPYIVKYFCDYEIKLEGGRIVKNGPL